MRAFLEQWRLDFTYAARALRRSPGFAAITVVTLALAIGVTAGMFSVVNAVLIRPMPYGDTDRLVYLWGTAPGTELPADLGFSSEFIVHFKQRAKTIEDLATYNGFTNTLRVGDRVERIRMSSPTSSLFATLGASPALGRLPSPTDENVALISDALWRDWFNADKNVLGKSFYMAGVDRTVIGVMGPEFRFPTDDTLAWVVADPREGQITPGRFGWDTVARMKPGATPEAVVSELTALTKELPGRFGGTAAYARIIGQYRVQVQPLAEQMVGASARPLWVLFGAAGIVLLIACANVANLFLVRAEGRHREMAVRQAIGARRGQLVRVQLSEVLLVAGTAAVIAVGLARVTVPVFVRLAPAGVPRLGDAGIDLPMILFTGALAIVAGFACGLFPALRASSPKLTRLSDGSRGTTRGRQWGRDALVAAQTALALVLLIGSGLLWRSHMKMSRVDPGFQTADLFTFQIAPVQPSLTDGPSYARFIMNFSDRLRALPGVQSVGVVENMPLDEGTALARFRAEARAAEPASFVNVTFAGEDYYKTMGIKVLSGRPFAREDATTSPGHIIVSRSAAKQFWPNADPVGQRIQRDGWTTWETVIGVVEDVIQNNYRLGVQPLVYLPLAGQEPRQYALSSPAYVIKTPRAETIGPEVRALVREVAPEAPMYRVYTLAELAERQMRGLSFTMLTLGLVSMLALVLGAIGLYGVLSYVVAQRTREIGVRMALGAQVSRVRAMVVAQGAQVLAVGVAVGLLVAWASTSALGSLLFDVPALDLATFAMTSVAMLGIGLFASYIPARRASNVDPIRSLHAE